MKIINVVIPAYNEEKNIKRCIESVLSQQLNDVSLYITIVDDCSSDNTGEIVKSFGKENVFLISNERNLGRSGSRNKGAFSIPEVDCLYFLDGDCFFKNTKCINNMILNLEKKNADICMGDVFGAGNSFWDKYYNLSKEGKGSEEKWSSQNFLIKNDLFVEISGFDEDYQNYGFEDRDLFYNCQKKGAKIVFVPVSVVNTFCSFTIEQVCKKMYLAGKSSANIFWHKHPEIYQKTSYFKVHYRNRRLDKLLLISLLNKKILVFLFNMRFPFFFKQKIAQILLALSFFQGTYEGKYE
ncbi:MAG: glycosyltransferase family A protein [Desulforegulaceae bacterium]|nr:glycosyltransferase family A protein [Desulforegulaceae bacterium]